MLHICAKGQDQRHGAITDGRKSSCVSSLMGETKWTSVPFMYCLWLVVSFSSVRQLLRNFQMGCYQEGIAKDTVAGKDVTAHIFECAFHLSIRSSRLTVSQIHIERRRLGERRSFSRFMPGPDHLLPQRTEQEEAQQSSLVLQCFRPLDPAQW